MPFIKLSVGIFGAVGIVALLPLFLFTGREIRWSVVVGGILAFTNLVLGYAAIEYSFEKPTHTFLKTMLIGTGIRLAMLMTAVVVLTKVFQFHVLALMMSLLVFYAINLALEIYFLDQRVSRRTKV